MAPFSFAFFDLGDDEEDDDDEDEDEDEDEDSPLARDSSAASSVLATSSSAAMASLPFFSLEAEDSIAVVAIFSCRSRRFLSRAICFSLAISRCACSGGEEEN